MSDEQMKVYFLNDTTNNNNTNSNANASGNVTTPRTGTKSNQLSSIMVSAFLSLKHRNFKPILCNGEEMMNKRINESDIFVIETFGGPIFDHLSRLEARIISPFIVKYCDGDSIDKPFISIPKRPYPIFSQCMRGLSITCSNFSSDVKKVVEQKVTQMCGNYYKDLNKDVNFLITDSVMTLKYKAAGSLNISIVKIDWVNQCWDRYQYEFKRGDSPEIVTANRLPIFHGLTIVISQLDSEERNKISELVTQNGGTYSAALKFNVPNTILLLRERSGEKFKFAILKKIPCLLVEWLYDSLEARYALPERDYYIDETQAQEEATKNVHISKSTVPAIAPLSKVCTNLVSPIKPTNSQLNSPSKSRSAKSLAKELNQLTSTVEDKSEFLSDCGLFAIGFDSVVLESIKTASRRCGALFLVDFRAKFVTHVIVGPNIDSDDLDLFKSNKIDKIVTIDWLFASIRAKSCSSHQPYRYSSSQRSDSSGKYSQSKKLGSSDSKILSISADQICKRIDFKQSDSTKLTKNFSQAMQSSQNFKSLSKENDDCPVVYVGTPKKNVPNYDGGTTTSDSNDNEDDEEDNYGGGGGRFASKSRSTSIKSSRNQSERESIDEDIVVDKPKEIVDIANDIAVVNADTVPLQNHTTNTDDDNDNIDDDFIPEDEEDDSIGMQDLSSLNCRNVECCFMFSGFEQIAKEMMISSVTKQLNVKICDDTSVNSSVTHLILQEPFASEKTLSAIAAGIWILKPQFVHDSLKLGQLKQEDQYEWGLTNSSLASRLQNKLMESAVNWRRHITNQGRKAFEGWNVIMLNMTPMIQSSTIILKSGGARVYFLEEIVIDGGQFRRLVETCKYAVVDIKFNSKPKMTRSNYLDYVDYMLKKSVPLIQHEVISRFIIQGPSSMRLEDKFKVTLDKIQAALATIS